MLDTGGHMAKVNGLAITPDGKQIVSGSQDKTIRVWDIETGQTLRLIRGEVAPGNWGMIHGPWRCRLTVASWLSVDSFMAPIARLGSAIRLHDFASGQAGDPASRATWTLCLRWHSPPTAHA